MSRLTCAQQTSKQAQQDSLLANIICRYVTQLWLLKLFYCLVLSSSDLYITYLFIWKEKFTLKGQQREMVFWPIQSLLFWILLIWGALGECAYFHSAPSPTELIFNASLLLSRLILLRNFSYKACFLSAPSSTALIYIPLMSLF